MLMTKSQFNDRLQTVNSLTMKFVIAIVLICVVSVVTGEGGATEEVCKSPIDIAAKDSKCGGGDGRPTGDFGAHFDGGVKSNGSWEAAVKINIPLTARPTIKIGSTNYTFEEFHFHVGIDRAKGSQHTLDGKYYDLEMHIPMAIVGGTDDYVLGFFVKVDGEKDNAAFDSLTKAIKKLHKAGDSKDAKISLKDIVAPAIEGEYFKYVGTDQLPPCGKPVPWLFYQTPLVISEAQYAAFRSVGNNGGFRPLAPLDGPLYNSKKC